MKDFIAYLFYAAIICFFLAIWTSYGIKFFMTGILLMGISIMLHEGYKGVKK